MKKQLKKVLNITTFLNLPVDPEELIISQRGKKINLFVDSDCYKSLDRSFHKNIHVLLAQQYYNICGIIPMSMEHNGISNEIMKLSANILKNDYKYAY